MRNSVNRNRTQWILQQADRLGVADQLVSIDLAPELDPPGRNLYGQISVLQHLALHLPNRVPFVGRYDNDLLVPSRFNRPLGNNQRDVAIAASIHRCRDFEQVVRTLISVRLPMGGLRNQPPGTEHEHTKDYGAARQARK